MQSYPLCLFVLFRDFIRKTLMLFLKFEVQYIDKKTRLLNTSRSYTQCSE